MAEHTTADTANDQAGGAIIASAVVTVVRAPIDTVVSAQPSRTITAIVASVIPSRISSRCVHRSDLHAGPIDPHDDPPDLPGDLAGPRDDPAGPRGDPAGPRDDPTGLRSDPGARCPGRLQALAGRRMTPGVLLRLPF